jgi:hypothetical protein
VTLDGRWRDPGGTVTIEIVGREPQYSFTERNFLDAIACHGTIVHLPDGKYLARGQGVHGPVSWHMWLLDENTLQARQEQNALGAILKLFSPMPMPIVPVLTFFRERQQIYLTTPFPDDDELDDEPPPPRKPERKPEARPQKPKPAPAAAQTGDPMAELGRLVGLGNVKQQLEQLDAWAWRQRELRGHQLEAEAPSMHMSFKGGPGTGKTTIARIIGRLLHQYELLEHGRVSEVGRADVVAGYIGQTALKAEKLIQEALGGVLFIDEAYALSEPGAGGGARDFGGEALAVLIAGMENHRHELCVIVAGYPAEMDRFIDANAGLASRISRHIAFPDYTVEEMQLVFESMARDRKLSLDPRILPAFGPYVRRAKAAAKPGQWGNARTVRNIIERGIENQSVRLRKAGGRPSKDQLLGLDVADFAFLTAAEITVT